MHRNKVEAFTLPELLMVMLLMGIVMGIVYTAYYMANTYYLNLQNRQSAAQNFSAIYFGLQTDIDRCHVMKASDFRTVVLTGKDSSRIVYEFLTKVIVRHQNSRTDTLPCNNQNFQFVFSGHPRLSGFIDKISFDVETTQGHSKVAISKQYDASTLIRQTSPLNDHE